MLRDAPGHDARAVSQLLYGEDFAVIDIAGGWAWGYCPHDDYVGYLPAGQLGLPIEPTHIVTAASSLIFSAADIKSPVVHALSIGARLAGVEANGFVATATGFVHSRHVAPSRAAAADPVGVAERLLGMPYLWGGRGCSGIDCSGLVQITLGLAGIPAPRDSDQQRTLGADIPDGEPLRRGDLVFFPGHVGLMLDSARLIHANAHWMAVTVDPLADVVARLGDRAILARRRIA